MSLFPRLTGAFAEKVTIVSLGEANEPLPKGRVVPECRVYVRQRHR